MTRQETIVFPWLHDDELARLTKAGVRLVNPCGEHFLELIPLPLQQATTKGDEPRVGEADGDSKGSTAEPAGDGEPTQ